MSQKYETVKRYYDSGLWDVGKVRNAVGRWITPEEFEMITGVLSEPPKQVDIQELY